MEAALSAIHGESRQVEIRALLPSGCAQPRITLKQAAELNSAGANIYFTLNPLQRLNGHAASDSDVAEIRWILT
jgi:hypothetical protein